jgi:lipopolysaccharide transport system ATP-binding protein
MTAIEFENISKQYRLGLVSTRTLSHDLNRWWKMNILGNEDPYLKIGEVNDRAHKGTSDYVWALKDIDFKVEQGDVLGIIGKNGAGKSTLLKILSKVTAPSTGVIRARGRIASLLEVGTGFHPEMTGRENIYMNGAIMGMTKAEINRKLDEIVDFSGVERYIDTPAKRYSSGMTVRLGFAIAAHLDPEILVVDEVLAVGDAEFQKKAIGKMQDVSRGEGRTVLFVSHNMTAIKNLCKNGIMLENGIIKETGKIDFVVNRYLSAISMTSEVYFENGANDKLKAEFIKIRNSETGYFDITQELIFDICIENKTVSQLLNINLFFNNSEGTLVFASCSEPKFHIPGKLIYTCTIPANFFNDNNYIVDLMVVENTEKIIFDLKDVLMIEGVEPKREGLWLGKFPGEIKPKFDWQVNEVL